MCVRCRSSGWRDAQATNKNTSSSRTRKDALWGRWCGRIGGACATASTRRLAPQAPIASLCLGPSTTMGSGVEAHETFEELLEARLNQESIQASSTSFEILNFGVAGYSPLHVLYQLERKVFGFEPNMAIFVGHASDRDATSRSSPGWLGAVRSCPIRISAISRAAAA